LQDLTPLVSPELADKGWIFTAHKKMIEHVMKGRLGSGFGPAFCCGFLTARLTY